MRPFCAHSKCIELCYKRWCPLQWPVFRSFAWNPGRKIKARGWYLLTLWLRTFLDWHKSLSILLLGRFSKKLQTLLFLAKCKVIWYCFLKMLCLIFDMYDLWLLTLLTTKFENASSAIVSNFDIAHMNSNVDGVVTEIEI